MTDALWVATAVTAGLLGFRARRFVRGQLGHRPVGRMLGEFCAWYGYIGAIAIVAVQTEGGWHTGRGGGYVRSTWSEEGPFYVGIATLLAVGFFLYGEKHGVDWLGDDSLNPFSASYVAEILDGEAVSSKAECRRMARRLRRIARKSRQPLPPSLIEFVDRHLDRTA